MSNHLLPQPGVGSSPTTERAENIAFLSLLHTVPIPPTSNPVNDTSLHCGRYTLSFAEERSLVSSLAFISYTKDDPDHIPAICFEEDSDSGNLTVLVAVNKNGWDDGNQSLGAIKEGFEGIFRILSHVQDGKYWQFFGVTVLTSRRS